MKMNHEAEWELNPQTRQTTASPIKRERLLSSPHQQTHLPEPHTWLVSGTERDADRDLGAILADFGQVLFFSQDPTSAQARLLTCGPQSCPSQKLKKNQRHINTDKSENCTVRALPRWSPTRVLDTPMVA